MPLHSTDLKCITCFKNEDFRSIVRLYNVSKNKTMQEFYCSHCCAFFVLCLKCSCWTTFVGYWLEASPLIPNYQLSKNQLIVLDLTVILSELNFLPLTLVKFGILPFLENKTEFRVPEAALARILREAGPISHCPLSVWGRIYYSWRCSQCNIVWDDMSS